MSALQLCIRVTLTALRATVIVVCLATGLTAADAPATVARGYTSLRLLFAASDFDIKVGSNGNAGSAQSAVAIEVEDGFGVGAGAGWWVNRWAALELELLFVPALALRVTEPIDEEIGNVWALTLIPALRAQPLATLLPEWCTVSGSSGAGTILTGGTWSAGASERSATGATLALRFAGRLDVRVWRQLFVSVDGGYVLAPAALSDGRVRLTPNLVLATTGLTLTF